MAANSVGGVETAKSDIDSDLELKKAEFGLKLEEFKARLAAEKRSIWFGSPLLVLALSTIFGLIGTGVGASLQGYWNTRLERQKFESTLIQTALQSTDADERAKNLLFLVDIGVLTNLDSSRIRALASKPGTLPIVRSSVAAHVQCSCPEPPGGGITCPQGHEAICIAQGGACRGECVQVPPE